MGEGPESAVLAQKKVNADSEYWYMWSIALMRSMRKYTSEPRVATER